MTKTLLSAAKNLLQEEKRWGKGQFFGEKCFCIIGAIHKAKGGNNFETRVKAIRKLHKSLADIFPAHLDIIEFNDSDSTNHDDVLELFDYAIESCE